MFRIEKRYFNGSEKIHLENIKDMLFAEKTADMAYRSDNDIEWVGVVEQDGTVVHERHVSTDGLFRRSAEEKAQMFRHARGEHRDTPKMQDCDSCYWESSI